jgi:uncharacterized membrane protein
MATMSALRFEDPAGPERMINTLQDLQRQGLITVLDAAVLHRKENGKVKVNQANSLVGAGALGGAFWGMLIGMLFFMPWLGAAFGAASGALTGKFSDYGIDDDFIKEVGENIKPGDSALFLYTADAVKDKVAAAVEGEQFEILHTNLSLEDEEALREVFGAGA